MATLYHPIVNMFVSLLKKILKKSRKFKNLYFEKTNLSLSPDVIQTRWGTFFKAACFYASHFELMKEFVEALSIKSKSKYIKEIKKNY